MKTKKEKIKLFTILSFIPFILIIIFTSLFGWKGGLISSLVLLIVSVELIYYIQILDHKGKGKFNVLEEKYGSICITIVFSIFSFLIGLLIGKIIKDIGKIGHWFCDYWVFFLIGFIILIIIVLVIMIFIWWFNLNKKLAIKKLGKDKVK